MEQGDKRGKTYRLAGLGNAYFDLGEKTKAIDYLEQALAVVREIEDRQFEAEYAWDLGLVYEESDPAKAATLMALRVNYEQEIGHAQAAEHAAYLEQVRQRIHAEL